MLQLILKNYWMILVMLSPDADVYKAKLTWAIPLNFCVV